MVTGVLTSCALYNSVCECHILPRYSINNWRKSFGGKDFDNQARSGRPKNVYSVLKTIEANPVRSTQRVLGEFGISQSSMIPHIPDLGGKSIHRLKLPKYCKTFDTHIEYIICPGIMVIVVGNGHGDKSSNPQRNSFI